METVLSLAVMAMVADAAITVVSGLSCYYSSAAAITVLFSVATAVDVTSDVDASFVTCKEGVPKVMN